MADPSPSTGPGSGSGSGPPAVINAGLFKTGTASMAEAYRILGLRPHHGLDLMDLPEHWAQLERAAEATWPDVPGAPPPRKRRPPPFARADWDAVFAGYGAVTDVGAAFAVELAAAYPAARVVVVERDPDRWLASFESQILAPIWGPLGTFIYLFVTPLVGNRGMHAMKKILYGTFGARDVEGLRANARRGYAAYYARVRAEVAAERRLEYRLGDGWEPLCAFLGVPVPDAEFPWVNEAAAHSRRQNEQKDEILRRAWLVLRPWVLGAAALAAAGVAYRLSR